MKHTLVTSLCVTIASMAAAQDLEAPFKMYESYEPFELIESFGPFVTDLDWFDQWKDAPEVLLTPEDYEEIAVELGVDEATIHAVIDIEAGQAHQGFWSEGKPMINFSPSLFRTYASRHGINVNKYAKSHAEAFANLNTAKYGSTQAAQQARLDAAMEIDPIAAIESTFWGMFQIAGFNWKRCGAQSPEDFVWRMQRSERDQLELFASFLKNTGLDKPLQKHDWSAFARGYNGPSYAARGYHTRLAKAYKKYL